MIITQVALRYVNRETGEEKLFSLPKPNRHSNLMHKAPKNGWARDEVLRAEQGFMYKDYDGIEKWCERKPAFTIAARAGQIVNFLNCTPGILFSEHLW